MINIYHEILQAEKRIHSWVCETPLDFSIALSKMTGTNVYLKCENLQYTGSFKVRGAFNAMLSLTKLQQEQGIVVASTGNHGAAIAIYGLRREIEYLARNSRPKEKVAEKVMV